jgi:hypothetical protein
MNIWKHIKLSIYWCHIVIFITRCEVSSLWSMPMQHEPIPMENIFLGLEWYNECKSI